METKVIREPSNQNTSDHIETLTIHPHLFSLTRAKPQPPNRGSCGTPGTADLQQHRNFGGPLGSVSFSTNEQLCPSTFSVLEIRTPRAARPDGRREGPTDAALQVTAAGAAPISSPSAVPPHQSRNGEEGKGGTRAAPAPHTRPRFQRRPSDTLPRSSAGRQLGFPPRAPPSPHRCGAE